MPEVIIQRLAERNGSCAAWNKRSTFSEMNCAVDIVDRGPQPSGKVLRVEQAGGPV
jgi:hypothetical protein